MSPVRGRYRYQIACISLVATLSVLLVGCGGRVSQDEFDAVQSDLEAARSQLQSLQTEKRALETQATGRELVGLGTVLTIDAVMTFPPTVVELKPSSAIIQMVTKVPTTCSIAYGLDMNYGQISTDDMMFSGGHTDHNHTLRGLQPDTLYHFKWGLLGPDGTLYGSDDLTLETPPAQ